MDFPAMNSRVLNQNASWVKRSQKWLRLLSVLVLSLALFGADGADTRMVTLRWTQEGDVAGFRIHRQLYRRAWDRGVDVGLPKKVDGVYEAEVEVSNLEATWIAISSYDQWGQSSERSGFRVYLLPES
jgi:hypothetical protein